MEYKRLTDKKHLERPNCYNCRYNYSNSMTCERYCALGDYFDLREDTERLVELEDKIEQGKLIELPMMIKAGTDWIIYYKCGDEIRNECFFEKHKEQAEERLNELRKV